MYNLVYKHPIFYSYKIYIPNSQKAETGSFILTLLFTILFNSMMSTKISNTF